VNPNSDAIRSMISSCLFAAERYGDWMGCPLEDEADHLMSKALYHPPTFEGENAEQDRREWARLLQLKVSVLWRKAAWLSVKKYHPPAFVEARSKPWWET
jgi:hypothetical protein